MAKSNGPSFVVGSGSGQAGSATTIQIPLAYIGDGTVVTFDFYFAYDSTSLVVDLSSCGGTLGGADVQFSEGPTGIIRLLAYDSSLAEIPSGPMGSISFDISAAPIG